MSDSTLVVRLCEPDDTAQIVPMIQAQVAAAGRPAPDPDAVGEVVHALLISQSSDFLLAEQPGRSVGVLQINYRLSTLEAVAYAVIEDFYLVPDVRGLGVGTRMLDYACARAEGRGAQFIQAAAKPGDRALRRLYEAFSFTATPHDRWHATLPLGCAIDQGAPADAEPNERKP